MIYAPPRIFGVLNVEGCTFHPAPWHLSMEVIPLICNFYVYASSTRSLEIMCQIWLKSTRICDEQIVQIDHRVILLYLVHRMVYLVFWLNKFDLLQHNLERLCMATLLVTTNIIHDVGLAPNLMQLSIASGDTGVKSTRFTGETQTLRLWLDSWTKSCRSSHKI